jgi:hypothetical protein
MGERAVKHFERGGERFLGGRGGGETRRICLHKTGF